MPAISSFLGLLGALRIYVNPFSPTFLSAFDVCSCLAPQHYHGRSPPMHLYLRFSVPFAHANSAAKNTLLLCFCLLHLNACCSGYTCIFSGHTLPLPMLSLPLCSQSSCKVFGTSPYQTILVMVRVCFPHRTAGCFRGRHMSHASLSLSFLFFFYIRSCANCWQPNS